MLDMIFDGFNWTVRQVNGFEMHHWALCLGLLLCAGFLCMRGLGVRGAR